MKTTKKPFKVFATRTLAISILTFLLFPLCTRADDTAALQVRLNAGDVTLTAGATYNVTGLTVTHALNLNWAIIKMTSATGTAIKLAAPGASITSGIVVGPWNYTTPCNPNGGALGIRIMSDNCSISKITLSAFPSYGILVTACNNPVINSNTISKIGYIGIYYCSEATTKGGSCSYNVVDRSMVPATTIQQGAIQIRASSSNSAYSTSGWTITGNVIKMPSLPASTANECMEVRFMTNSTVSGNTFTAGTIGCSAVGCNNVTLLGNKFSGSSLESIEFADCTSCTTQSNIISSSLGMGILLDGTPGCVSIKLSGDNIAGTAADCIHAYTNTSNLTISGVTMTVGQGNKGTYLQNTSGVTITNTTFNGNSAGNLAIFLDTSAGNVTINGGAISNFTNCVMAIYSTKAGLVTNNITMTGVKVTGVPKGLSTLLLNGATVGSNIVVVNQ